MNEISFVWRGPKSHVQIVAALCDDGLLRFVDVQNSTLVSELGTNARIDGFACCANGRYVLAIQEAGTVTLYSVDHLLSNPVARHEHKSMVASSGRSAAKLKGSSASQRGRGRPGSGNTVGPGPGPEAAKIEMLPAAGGRGSVRRPENRAGTDLASQSVREDRLMTILHGYGEFPVRYRRFIWRQILRLPENFDDYHALLAKGTHNAYKLLHQEYPLKSRKSLRIFQRNLSALAHWAPIFGELDYLPRLAFPIIKYFENAPIVSFEIIATVVTNWCQQWFDFFPNPPINVLNMVENLLAHHDSVLYRHLYLSKVTSQLFAWPLLRSLFSEVLTEGEWLVAWDNIFSNAPSFLYYMVVSYLTHNRVTLLQCNKLADFKFFFHHKNPIKISKVVTAAYNYIDRTPAKIDPGRSLKPFAPLSAGQYPVFNKYPAYIVNYEVQERERIRDEEVQFLKQRALALEARNQTESLRLAEEAWHQQQELLEQAEHDRRAKIKAEEHKLAEQRKRLAILQREEQIAKLQALESSRQKFVDRQKRIRQMEIHRVEDSVADAKLGHGEQVGSVFGKQARLPVAADRVATAPEGGIVRESGGAEGKWPASSMGDLGPVVSGGSGKTVGDSDGRFTSGDDDGAYTSDSLATDRDEPGVSLSRINRLTYNLDGARLEGRRNVERQQLGLIDKVMRLRRRVATSEASRDSPA